MPTQKHDRPQWNCSEIDDHHHPDDSNRNGAIGEHLQQPNRCRRVYFRAAVAELGERVSFDTGGGHPVQVYKMTVEPLEMQPTTNTTKTFGTDPSSQNVPGCVDATDTLDFSVSP